METTNHEYYVSLEVAKLLKQAGFDWKCRKIYYEDEDTCELEDNYKKLKRLLELDYCFLAPTLDVAQRWLREVKDEYVVIEIVAPGVYKVSILGRDCTSKSFKTYEEAQEAGIKKALEIILECK